MPRNLHLRRSVHAVATLAIAYLAAPSTAHADFESEWGGNINSCALPTESECLDPEYASTWCGAKPDARELCGYYAVQQFQLAYSASPHPMGYTIPPKHMPDAGFRSEALLVPADPPIDARGPSTIHHLAHIRGDELAIASAPDLYDGMAWAKRLEPRHPFGENFRVDSCEAYVYKRWYEYSRFEDAARTCGNDAMCVFQVGRTTTLPGITGPLRQFAPANPYLPTIPADLTPRSQDPAEIGGPAPSPFQAKNAFFRVTPATILRASSQYANDAAFAADTEALIAAVGTPALYDTTNRMQWHVEMEAKQRPLDLDRAERKDIARRLRKYDRLVEEYLKLRPADDPSWGTIGVDLGGGLDDADLVRLSASPVAIGLSWGTAMDFLGAPEEVPYDYAAYDGGGAEDMPIGLSPEVVAGLAHGAVVDEMAELLMAEWRHLHTRDRVTKDRGCLINVSCDWLPEMFQDDYVGRFQTEREADLMACITATSTPVMDWTTWTVTSGIPEAAGADVGQLTAYIEAKREENRMRAMSLPWTAAPHGAPEGSRNIRWGVEPYKEAQGIKGLLWAYYEHHATADVALKINAHGDACNLSAGVSAGIQAKYTAPRAYGGGYIPDPTEHVVVDGTLDARVNRGGQAFYFDSHLTVAGQVIFDPYHEEIPIEGGTWEPAPLGRHFPIYAYAVKFTIVGIPAFLSVDIQGDVAIAPRIHVPAYVENCDKPLPKGAEIMPKVEGSLTASVDIDADGKLAIGIPGFSAGVAGHIDLVTASLPATATLAITNEPGGPALALDLGARFDMTLFAGSISVYAQALMLKVEKTILGWPGVPVGFELWNEHARLPLSDVLEIFKVSP